MMEKMKIAGCWLFSFLLITLTFASCSQSSGDDDEQTNAYDNKLYRCENCDELLEWMQTAAIEEMTRIVNEANYYWGDDDDYYYDDDDAPINGDDDGAPTSGDDDAADDDYAADDDQSGAEDDQNHADDDDGGSSGDDYTDTNVQEEGVDEADLVKTDGDTLFLATGGYLLLYDVANQAPAPELSRVDIEGYVFDMYAYNDIALVLSKIYSNVLPQDIWPEVERDDLYYGITKLTLVDYSARTAPIVVRELYLEGDLISSRRVDAAARVVLSSYKMSSEIQYYVDYEQCQDETSCQEAIADLIAANTEIIQNTTVADWLPRYYSILHTGGAPEIESGNLSECDDHYRPAAPLGHGILSVVTLNLDEPASRQADISIVSDGLIVYASPTNLYVSGTSDLYWEWGWITEDNYHDTCPIHRFDIADPNGPAVYRGTAEVTGWLLNQFSMSEYQGYLRVATTFGGWPTDDPLQNGIFIYALEENGFTPAGSVTGLGENENLYAVRMMGSRGFIVTFMQTDPLFTIDLSDPNNPALVGELEIPGFSSYLHSMDDDHLLAIGQGGDEWGTDGTMVVTMFDISDFANPQQLHQYNFGWSYSDAQYDHHAFLYDPSRNLLALPLTDYGWYGEGEEDTGSGETEPGDNPDDSGDDDVAVDDDDDDYTGDYFAGVVVLSVSAEQGFTEEARIDHYGMEPEAGSDNYWYDMPLPLRSVRVGDYLFTISDVALIVTDITTWENVAEISLPWEEEEYYYGDDDYSGGEDDIEVPVDEDGK